VTASPLTLEPPTPGVLSLQERPRSVAALPFLGKPPTVLAHWHILLDDFSTSALEFYQTVEESVHARQLPDVRVSRVDWREGGWASAKREYLRIARGRLTYDICAAPYGTGFFFSSWMASQSAGSIIPATFGILIIQSLILLASLKLFGTVVGLLGFVGVTIVMLFFIRSFIAETDPIIEDAIIAIPILGSIYLRLFKATTYFSEDSRMMFQDSVHRVVTQSVDQIRIKRGLRALAAHETQMSVRNLV